MAKRTPKNVAGDIPNPAGRRTGGPDLQTPLVPPPNTPAGSFWANHQVDGSLSPLELLRDEISDLQDPENSSPQVAIELVDRGQRTFWGGAGDTPEWEREPASAVLWIGNTSNAELVIHKALESDSLGQVLCRGASIQLSRRDGADRDSQRLEAEAIRACLSQAAPGNAAPLWDQAVFTATRLADESTSKGYFDGIPVQSVQDAVATSKAQEDLAETRASNPWYFGAGPVTFLGKVIPVTRNQRKILECLANATGYVSKKAVMDKVWDEEPSQQTFSSTLTGLRNLLRETFGLTKKQDPIPSSAGAEYYSLSLDEGLLRGAASGKNQSIFSSDHQSD